MAHNYEDRGLPHGMELDEMHEHADGHTQEEVNAHHARMTAGAGSSEEQYAATSSTAERELGREEGEKEPKMTPPSNSGKAVR